MTLGDNMAVDYDGGAPAGLTVTLSYSGSSAGYKVVWSVNGTAIDVSTFTMPAENSTVTATLTPIEYTITYELDSGTAEGNPGSYTVESLPITLNNPTKDGFMFTGWTWEGQDEPEMTVTIPAGSTGNLTYTANWKENAAPADTNPKIAFNSLILSGQIGVNFYAYFPDFENNANDYWMTFSISGIGEVDDAAQNPREDFTYTQNGQTYYGFKCYVNSLQMADTITATLRNCSRRNTISRSAKAVTL